MIMIKIVKYNVTKNIVLKQKILKSVLHNVMVNINIFINRNIVIKIAHMIIGILLLKEKYVQNKMNVMLFIVDNNYIHIYIQANSV